MSESPISTALRIAGAVVAGAALTAVLYLGFAYYASTLPGEKP